MSSLKGTEIGSCSKIEAFILPVHYDNMKIALEILFVKDVVMAFLTNPNLGYVLIVVGVTLVFLGIINSKSTILNVGVLFCLFAVGLGFLYLRMNPWAFLVVALSPLPFYMAVRQARAYNPLFLLAICMLTIGSFFIFVDQDNAPVVSNRWAWVAVVSATITWLSTERLRNKEGARISHDPDSVIGLLGETITDIEPYSAGSVMVGGEVWQARSKEPIPAGSTVRVVRQDGFWLTVKKVEKISKR